MRSGIGELHSEICDTSHTSQGPRCSLFQSWHTTLLVGTENRIPLGRSPAPLSGWHTHAGATERAVGSTGGNAAVSAPLAHAHKRP